MLARGARKFVFLGRTGAKRAASKQLVDDLEKAGAEVTVIRGDVAVYSDVERALGQIGTPIGGVVQAAMGLDVSSVAPDFAIIANQWRGRKNFSRK